MLRGKEDLLELEAVLESGGGELALLGEAQQTVGEHAAVPRAWGRARHLWIE